MNSIYDLANEIDLTISCHAYIKVKLLLMKSRQWMIEYLHHIAL